MPPGQVLPPITKVFIVKNQSGTASGFPLLHKKYASLAMAASLATILTYASAALVTTVIQVHESDHLTVAYGNFVQARTLAMVGCVGISIMTLRTAILATKQKRDFDPASTSIMIFPAVISSVLCAVLLMFATFTSAAANDPAIHWLLWLTSLPAVVVTPATLWLTALFQSRNQDRGLVRITATRLVVTTTLSVGVILAPLSTAVTAAAIGVLSSAGSVWTLWSLRRACPVPVPGWPELVVGSGLANGQWRAAWAKFGGSLVAISDVLPVIVMLTILGAVSAQGDVAEAAVVQVAMSYVRLTVVPLKQAGSVAGRLVLQAGVSRSTLTKLYWLPASLAGVFVVSFCVAGAGIAASPLFVAFLCGQVVCDSITLYETSAFKVLQDPGFGRWIYLGVIVGLAIPAVLAAGFLGYTSPSQLWSVMLASRVLLLLGITWLIFRPRSMQSQ